MIKSFSCEDTKRLFEGKNVPRFANISIVAARKLQQLDSAVTLDSMRAPPGNRLELLQGDRSLQYSVRINSQWRLCFVWEADGPCDVEIVDYH